MAELPIGTVTFLFTDIEGSTRLWEQHPEAMRASLARHDALATSIIEQHTGILLKSRGEGDSHFAVFARATDALSAVSVLQQSLVLEPWPPETPLRVRLALHTGEADRRGSDYYGSAVNRGARLRAIAHGGQVLLSRTTADLVWDALPEGTSLRDLGVHRLRDLQRPEHIFQPVHPDLPGEFPALQSLNTLPNNLPEQVTSFIGRRREAAEVKRLLKGTRLLTLTGAGGTGKTRLALQVAADLLEGDGDGVWLVELAPLADPDLVPQAVASVLGVGEEPGKPLSQTLVKALKPKTLLLVLDNCEHLLAACATLTDALLRGCPGVHVLATSREVLGIGGEQAYRLPPLSVPPPTAWMPGRHRAPALESATRYEAMHLFLDRARLSHSTFALTPGNAPAVAQICYRLDGIPLAIELAAARVKALSVEQIAQRLDDRFRLLTGGSRTVLPRQQTLRALIDWSYDLLSDPERALLQRLSVFAGGWTLEAAEAVCAFGASVESEVLGVKDITVRLPISTLNTQHLTLPLAEGDVLDLLTALVAKSLVVYDESESDGRYRLLETVRQYARERLLETQAGEQRLDRDSGQRRPPPASGYPAREAGGGPGASVRGRHRDWFLALAEQAAPELRGPRQVAWQERLESEHDNLRAALEWCSSEGRRQKAVGSPGSIEAGLPTADCRLPSGPEAELRLAGALEWFWIKRSYLSEGRQRLEGALSRSSGAPSSLRMWALLGAGRLAALAGEYAAAFTCLQSGLELARVTGDPEGIATALATLALQPGHARESEQGTVLAEESLVWAREAGDPWLIAVCLMVLGWTVRMSGDLARATPLYRDSLALMRQVGDQWGMVHVLLNLGGVAQAQGDDESARRAYQEGLALSRELKDRRGMAWCLESLAEIATAQGCPRRGARLMGMAEGLLDAIGASWLPLYVAGRERAMAAIRAALGDDTSAAALAEGRAMPLEEAFALALEDAPNA